MLDTVSTVVMFIVLAITVFATRAASFIVFPKDREIPPTVLYIGRLLPPAVIGMLVVYCLSSTQVFEYPYGIPELIAGLTVIGLQMWKHNTLLSVGAGTILYMTLVQVVF